MVLVVTQVKRQLVQRHPHTRGGQQRSGVGGLRRGGARQAGGQLGEQRGEVCTVGSAAW